MERALKLKRQLFTTLFLMGCAAITYGVVNLSKGKANNMAKEIKVKLLKKIS